MAVIAPRTANDLAISAAFERELMADHARDTFVILRDVPVSDGAGGRRKTQPDIIGMGRCLLRPLQSASAEQVIADRIGWTVAYAIDLDDSFSVSPANRIIVNGSRTFEIGGVIDVGESSTQKTLIVREH